MEVQEVIVASFYDLQAWIDTLTLQHFIAMVLTYFFGYWLRGHRHE